MNSTDLHIHLSGAESLPVTLESTPERRPASAFDLLASQPWAMQPAMLETMAAIAQRQGEDVQAVEARLGRPLQNARSVSVRDGVAVVPVIGPIFRYANLFTEISGATSLDVLAREFSAAVDDPLVKAVVLNIDSPGGQATGVAEFAHMIRAAAKPVVAYVDGSGASGAYWIAAAADEIVLAKTAEVGSIGVVVGVDTRPSATGVVELVSSQSPRKRPDLSTDAGRAQIQDRIDALAQVFVEDVAAYRGVAVETVLAEFGQGDMRLGAAAVALGMADRVSTLEEVLAGLAGATHGGRHMGAQATDDTPQTVTLDTLAQDHPALVAELRAQGAQAERERVLAVQAQALPGHEALIARLAADGVTTGPEAAVAVLAAERALGANRARTLQDDAPDPVPFAAAPDPGEESGDDARLPIEQRCAARWERDQALHEEFSSLAAYTAYVRSIDSGRARVLGHK